MFHLPRINLTQLQIILSCLVPWDTAAGKHVLLAKMRYGYSAKWELVAGIKILCYLQMISVYKNSVLQYTQSLMSQHGLYKLVSMLLANLLINP